MIRTLCPKYFSQNTCRTNIMSAELLRNDLQHRFDDERRKMNSQDDPPSTSLLIVRDPFERLVSCYLDKIVKRKPGFEAIIVQILSLYRPILSEVVPFKDVLLWNAAHERDEKKKIWTHHGVTNPYHSHPTFSEFISFITSGHYNDHWMPIFHNCQPCFHRYDYIVKLEHFDEEFSWFIKEKQLNIAYNPYTKKKSSSRSKVIELFTTLSDTRVVAFHDIFKGDCELFDYDCKETMADIRAQRLKQFREQL